MFSVIFCWCFNFSQHQGKASNFQVENLSHFIQETAETPLKDDKLAVKEVAKGKEKSEFDDLGSLSDYEFGE